MPLKIIDHGTKEYEKMVELRYQVLRKPLGLQFSKEELDNEKSDILIGAYEEEDLLACCMLTRVGPTTVRLRQMAVKVGIQGKGIGRAMMQFAENLARDRGNKIINMHARKTAVGFYEKMGYKTTGEEFEEVTIQHCLMEKQL
jgi:predicted GNAT family N-acyltransferase